MLCIPLQAIPGARAPQVIIPSAAQPCFGQPPARNARRQSFEKLLRNHIPDDPTTNIGLSICK